MDWPDLVSEGLPPPRSDEPARLRQDIADELADHLACALSRELRRADDETAARRAVLDRFGDPKAIARRLWFDAMKEIIMRERLVLVLAGVLLITVLVGGLLTWQSMRMNRDVNQAILAKLDSMNTPAARAEVPENWSKAKIRLARGTPDGPPIAGKRVELEGKPFNDADKKTLGVESDRQGVTVFGPIRPGEYRVHTRFLWLELATTIVNLYPGQVQETTVSVPAWIDEEPAVSIRIAPTNAQIKEGTLLYCEFLPDQPYVRCGSDEWAVSNMSLNVTMAGERVQAFFVGGQRTVTFPIVSRPDPAAGLTGVRRRPGEEGGTTKRVSLSSTTASLPLETRPTVLLPLVKWRLARVVARIPNDGQTTGTGGTREWLSAAAFDYATQRVRSDFPQVLSNAQEPPRGPPPRSADDARGPLPPPANDDRKKLMPLFDVTPAGENVWTIELPPAFVEQIIMSTKQLDESKAFEEQARLEEEKLTAEQAKVAQSRPAGTVSTLPPSQTQPQPR